MNEWYVCDLYKYKDVVRWTVVSHFRLSVTIQRALQNNGRHSHRNISIDYVTIHKQSHLIICGSVELVLTVKLATSLYLYKSHKQVKYHSFIIYLLPNTFKWIKSSYMVLYWKILDYCTMSK